MNNYNIKYGTVLKINYLTSDNEFDVDTIMLVDNITAGSKYNCKVLDLHTFEILADYESIDDFLDNVNIVEVIGNFSDMFYI